MNGSPFPWLTGPSAFRASALRSTAATSHLDGQRVAAYQSAMERLSGSRMDFAAAVLDEVSGDPDYEIACHELYNAKTLNEVMVAASRIQRVWAEQAKEYAENVGEEVACIKEGF